MLVSLMVLYISTTHARHTVPVSNRDQVVSKSEDETPHATCPVSTDGCAMPVRNDNKQSCGLAVKIWTLGCGSAQPYSM